MCLLRISRRRFMHPHAASQKLRTRSSQRHGKFAFSHDGERGGEALQRDFMISDSRLWDRWVSLLLVVSTGHLLSTLKETATACFRRSLLQLEQ